jgi:C-terminal peptidase prc
VVLSVIIGALAGGLFGSRALARVRPPDLQRHHRHAPDARPHSSFMDPRSYAQMRERQEGRYYGLGISIQVIDGDITVDVALRGSPAYERGIRRGDVIARIEGEVPPRAGPASRPCNLLRGPKGTSVNISVRARATTTDRPAGAARRGQIPPSARRSCWTRHRVHPLQDFSETTDQEVGRALQKLTRQGMQRLVFDLRDNPGGPLDQAIKVANRFLPRGSMIVYTRGRVANADQDYRATEQSDYPNLPLIVLVNRNSASASEIVAGRAAGPRPRAHRRRDHVRQGARAVGLPHQQEAGLAMTTAATTRRADGSSSAPGTAPSTST